MTSKESKLIERSRLNTISNKELKKVIIDHINFASVNEEGIPDPVDTFGELYLVEKEYPDLKSLDGIEILGDGLEITIDGFENLDWSPLKKIDDLELSVESSDFTLLKPLYYWENVRAVYTAFHFRNDFVNVNEVKTKYDYKYQLRQYSFNHMLNHIEEAAAHNIASNPSIESIRNGLDITIKNYGISKAYLRFLNEPESLLNDLVVDVLKLRTRNKKYLTDLFEILGEKAIDLIGETDDQQLKRQFIEIALCYENNTH